jgi:hypothetical protein
MRSAITSVSGGLVAAFLFASVPSTSAFGQVFTWANGLGGPWNTSTNWNPIGVPDNAGKSALINLGGTFTITVSGGPVPDSVQLLSTGGTISIANNASLGIGGASGLVNNGTIVVNQAAGLNFTTLRYFASAPLSGSGFLRLNAAANLDTAYIETSGGTEISHQAPHRILGTGRISAKMTNASEIIADVAGDKLEITGQLTQTEFGQLLADPGIISLGNNGAVSGGTINSANGGTWQVVNAPSVSAVTINAPGRVLNNSTLRVLAGGMVNNSVLEVNSGGINFTKIVIEEAATIGGIGSIHLRAASNLDTAYLESLHAQAILTQSASHSITGGGRIYATTINQGTVRANTVDRLLEIRGTFTQQGAGRIVGDNADAALGTGALVSGGSIQTVGTGRVRVTGDARLSGVTNFGVMAIDNNHILRLLSGGLNNLGVLTVNATAGINFTQLRIDESCTLAGAGSIALNAGANTLDTAYVETLPSMVLTNSASHTIRGTGRVYAKTTNAGEIIADVAGKVLEIRGEITQDLAGRITGNPGIAALGNGAVITGGNFHSGAGGVVRTSGTAKVSGTSNIGILEVANNTQLRLLAGGLNNAGSVVINPTSGLNFTSLVAEEACTITGVGTVTLNATATPDTAYIDGGTVGLTIAPQQIITGNGRMYGSITNQGKIRGSGLAGNVVRIRGNVTQTGAGAIIGGVGSVGLDTGSVTGGKFQSNGGPVRALSGTSSMSGVENIGELQLDNNARLSASSFVNNGTVTINDGNGLNFTTLSFPGVETLSGVGEILLRASGNLDTAYLESVGEGAKLTIGENQIIRGTGRMHGEFESSAVLSPGLSTGAIGRFEPRGPLTLTPDSRIDIDIAGGDPGQFDAIASNSPVAIGGSLALAITGWDPNDPCISIPIVTGSAITGEFFAITIDSPEPPAGRVWRLDYELTKVSLRLTCAADLNGDCVVDDRDFLRFVFAYNLLDCADPAMPQNCPADLNYDGVVDDTDFTIWIVAYNELICG